MTEKRSCGGLDVFRLIAAFLVVAIHTSPFADINETADFFLTRILARTAVPLFFMITGQFVLRDCFSDFGKTAAHASKQIKKLLLFYGGAILLYLPIGIYAGHYEQLSIAVALRMFLFDGTFYHLWYFPACITGIAIVCLLCRYLSARAANTIAILLYGIGLFGDSYYGLISEIPIISTGYEYAFHIFSYTRNGLFLAPVFLLMGAQAGRYRERIKPIFCGIGLAVSFLLMSAEGFILRHFAVQRHDSMYLFLLPCMFFLYQLLLSWGRKPAKYLRTVSTWIYLLHPAVIVLIRGAAKALNLTKFFVDNSLIHYLSVCLITWMIAAIIPFIANKLRAKPFPYGRAWIELDPDALQNNVDTLRTLLPDQCALMPAVKANAYGHGAVLIAKELNRMGIKAFCVACISEGIELRKHGVRGEILILGYTHPQQFPLLRRYRLTQTVIDYPYAVLLNQYKRPLHVHIGLDTGMHRLGERCDNIEQLYQMFRMKHLRIDGLFTHLCADDTKNSSDQEFTAGQVQAFYNTVSELESRGITCPKLHLQSSYGVVNYPELAEDYARVGIGLYGLLSTKEDTESCTITLRPVLSLKARIATVKDLRQGEFAGYGLQFTAERDMKIATIAIGYADGLPRALSNGVGSVLIDGHRAPIIGRICMDQTTVDISDIPDVKAGDIAVLIGRSEGEEITAGDIARQADTITNEILSRMGARLESAFRQTEQQ